MDVAHSGSQASGSGRGHACYPQCPDGRRLPADTRGMWHVACDMWHVAQSSIECVVTGCVLGSAAAAADGLWAPRQSGWQRHDEQQGRKHCGIKRQGKICIERIPLRLRNWTLVAGVRNSASPSPSLFVQIHVGL